MATTARQVIREELRALRKADGILDVAKMVHAPAIVKGLGGDDPKLALDRLLQLASQHQDDLDIEAAIFTMGHGATTDSVLDRHSEWGALNFMDQRSARRYTDRGITKLVGLIMGPAAWLQPTAVQLLQQSGDLVTVQFKLRLPPEVAMQQFEVFLNGDEQGTDFQRDDRKTHPRSYTSSLQPLLLPARSKSLLRVRWRGEKTPVFEIVIGGEVNAFVRAQFRRWEMSTQACWSCRP